MPGARGFLAAVYSAGQLNRPVLIVTRFTRDDRNIWHKYSELVR